MITEQQLIDEGYTKYTLDDEKNILFPYAEFFYQKKILDKNERTKYFIEFVYYKETVFPNSAKVNSSWMVNLQIGEYQFQQHRVENLQKAKELCEKFFIMLGRKYYDEIQKFLIINI